MAHDDVHRDRSHNTVARRDRFANRYGLAGTSDASHAVYAGSVASRRAALHDHCPRRGDGPHPRLPALRRAGGDGHLPPGRRRERRELWHRNRRREQEGNGSIVVAIDGPDGQNVPVRLTGACFPGGEVVPGGFAYVAIPYADPPWPSVPAGQGAIFVPRFLLEQPSGRGGAETLGEYLQALEVYANGERCGTFSTRPVDWDGDAFLALGSPGQPAACSRASAEICLDQGPIGFIANTRYVLRDGHVLVTDLAPAPPHTRRCAASRVYPAPPDSGRGTAGDGVVGADTPMTALGAALGAALVAFGAGSALILARRSR